MDASRAVSQLRVVAIWRSSVEWQRCGMEAVQLGSDGAPSGSHP